MSEAAGRLTVDIVNYYGLWSGKVWLSCVCKASSSKWQKSNKQELKEWDPRLRPPTLRFLHARLGCSWLGGCCHLPLFLPSGKFPYRPSSKTMSYMEGIPLPGRNLTCCSVRCQHYRWLSKSITRRLYDLCYTSIQKYSYSLEDESVRRLPQNTSFLSTETGLQKQVHGVWFFGWRWCFSQFSHRSSKVFVLLPKGKIIKSDRPAQRPVVMWGAPETLAAGVEITRRTPASRTSPWSDSAELGYRERPWAWLLTSQPARDAVEGTQLTEPQRDLNERAYPSVPNSICQLVLWDCMH